jgi:hypothetical protein
MTWGQSSQKSANGPTWFNGIPMIPSREQSSNAPPLGLHAEAPDPDPSLVAQTNAILGQPAEVSEVDLQDNTGYHTIGSGRQ